MAANAAPDEGFHPACISKQTTPRFGTNPSTHLIEIDGLHSIGLHSMPIAIVFNGGIATRDTREQHSRSNIGQESHC